MSPETIILIGIAVLVGFYGAAAIVAYQRNQWKKLSPVEADRAATFTGAKQTPVAAPDDPHADEILRAWFAGKSCAICSRPIPPIHRAEPHPGLMNERSQAHDLIPWENITRDEHLKALLESHAPVCSHCMMAETFRQRFPDLVVDRPEHGGHVL